MRMLHQHPEGMVYVRTDESTYGDTPENFARDYGAKAPPLPEGMTERIYEPGKRHALICDHDVVDGGPMPWPEGDKILAKLGRLLAAKAAREQED